MIKDYIIIAIKNFKKRKLRSFLTLLGILIAIATIFILISISIGLQNAVQEQFRLLGTDKFFIQPRGQLAGPGTEGAVELTENDIKAIEKVSGVKALSPWTATSAKIEFAGEIRYITIIGIDLETSELFVETGAYEAEEGRVLKKGDSKNIMIGSQYKHNNFFKRPVKARDKILINNKEKFTVKGILESIGNSHDDRFIYMPIRDFRSLFDISNRIDTIVVQIEQGEDIKDVAEKVKRKLLNKRGLTEKTRDFTILAPEELLESFSLVLNIITAFLLGIATISLLVGGIGIANTMYTSVLERTKEIGIMKSIGAKNSDILSIFLIESALLGLVGGIVGVILGAVVSKTIEYIAIAQLGTTLLQAATPFYLIIGCLLFASLIGSLSGFLPAYQATKIKPVDALRYE